MLVLIGNSSRTSKQAPEP